MKDIDEVFEAILRGESVTYKGKQFMFGQQWYELFKELLYKPPKQTRIAQNDDGESHDRFFRDGGTNFMYDRAIEAAKKAAGLI